MDINNITIESIGLSNRSYNALKKAKISTVGEIAGYDLEKLLTIPNLGLKSANEIMDKICYYKKLESEDPSALLVQSDNNGQITEFRKTPEYHGSILEYVRSRDVSIDKIGFSNRSRNQLQKNGYSMLSDIIFLTEEELKSIQGMGRLSIEEVLGYLQDFFSESEEIIRALHEGDKTVLWNIERIKSDILALYSEDGFVGLSYKEIKDSIDLPEDFSDSDLKKVIGKLLTSKELEYVDFRLYRVYDRFEDYLAKTPLRNERDREIVEKRLNGSILADIGKEYDFTRERARQIIKKTYKAVRDFYWKETGKEWFDEDYYKYFYETYSFDKQEASKWFGITISTWNYLAMEDVKRGDKPLSEAIDDKEINAGMRLKIKNYINRDKVFIDGSWVMKRRADLEEAAIRKYCKEDVTFNKFCDIYNSFLRDDCSIEFDESLYITDDVKRTRKNVFSQSRVLLWKQNELIRYYDIDSRDYSELIEELNLEHYNNIELSTAKLVADHPEIMERYDIRDQYELHNLLRKVIPQGSFNEFKCGRMPMIVFGTFDRDKAIEEILMENAPLRTDELVDMIHSEYGYDKATTLGTYLKCVNKYYHDGMYSVDFKQMSPKSRFLLEKALTEDFYFFNEIRKIYKTEVPEGDPEEINSYNLKSMGFSVYSNYVLRNHQNLESYFEHLFLEKEVLDITGYRKRYGYVVSFTSKLMEMKRNLRIVEFEPNQIVNFSRIESAGVTKADIHEFCDAIYRFVGEGRFFSLQSARKAGFQHKVFDLGFADWFYANLLLSDERFSSARFFNNIILFSGKEDVTISSFISNRVHEHGVVDVYDLMNELSDIYGCKGFDRYDLTLKLKNTEVYYDDILDRMYADALLYEQELEEAEVL